MSTKTRKQQIEYIKNLKDDDIDYSDAPEATDFTYWEPNPFFKLINVNNIHNRLNLCAP